MMEYPVFFECPGLNEEQKKRIEKYFHIQRKSGGGDCGSLTETHDKVYRIAFKDRDAQQRVLQRSEHVVELAGGPLVLTVRDSPEPTSKSISPKVDLTSSQGQQSTLASSPLTSGEDYELQLDPYLLRYFKECPKAEEELEKGLTSLACSAKINQEEGRILVRSLAQTGAVDEVRNWKAEVDKLFDGYQCHYEVDPHKVKAVLQSCSSSQTTDEVKVYSEVGMAVVVGKCSQVTARVIDMMDLHESMKQGSRLSQKQTISSGVFGVPVTVCSEAIVTAVKEFASQGGRSLSRIILIDNRGEVVRAMQEACDRLLQGITTGNSPTDLGFQAEAPAQDTERGASAGAPRDGVHVEIIQGTLETQQVDGLASPMVGHDPLSTRVGNALSSVVGPQLTAKLALDYCRDHYRQLVSITNPHQQRWVQKRAKNADTPYVWLGLRYTCALDLWFWVSDQLVSYNNWDPEGRTDWCYDSAAMERGGQHKWVKKTHTEMFNFICAM